MIKNKIYIYSDDMQSTVNYDIKKIYIMFNRMESIF